MLARSGEQTDAPLNGVPNQREWPVFWRVEGSLATLTAVRPVAYFTWNAHTFAERWARRGGLFLQALVRPALYASHRVLATRILHALLRGVSRDRLDLLGEEYFQYVLEPQLRPEGVAKLREWLDQHGQVVLVSQGLDHVMGPLARHLGIERIVSNRLEFRNGVATGRLLNPVIRPRGPLAFFAGGQADGRISAEQLLRDLGIEKIVEAAPVFDRLEGRYGKGLSAFLAKKLEVVEGDVSLPGLGIDDMAWRRLARVIDLVVNSSGLTDFNPDLRDGLASNVEPAAQLVEFLRASDHAALLHLSTCYVVGARDGRVAEDLKANYTPAGVDDFNFDRELLSLQELARKVEERAHSSEVEAALRRQALGRLHENQRPPGREIDELIRKNRLRWIRNRLTRAATRRARRLGRPNTYTFTKSLAESLLAARGAGLPIAVVRPSIVETSIEQPFRGWNEGINTSAPLSYLLGTYFRQLPSNERKRLDVIRSEERRVGKASRDRVWRVSCR